MLRKKVMIETVERVMRVEKIENTNKKKEANRVVQSENSRKRDKSGECIQREDQTE